MSDARSDKAFPVSWDQFHRDARALSWRLADRGKWEAIVCVTRGGLVPAAIIARELGIRLIETVCVASYHDYKEQGGIEVLKPVGHNIVDLAEGKGAGVLVIDDLVDTGRTARLVRDMVPKCHYATMYAKPAGRPLVDTFITEVSQDTWIYFPWDMGWSFQPPIAQGDGRLMADEQPPIDEDMSEAERLLEEDRSALFSAITGVMDERGLDEQEIVPLLLDAAYHFRAVGYVVETAKPSEAGLRMDFDRLRKLTDEVHRDYRKNAGNVVRDIVAMLESMAERMEEEEAAQSVKPTAVLFDGSGR